MKPEHRVAVLGVKDESFLALLAKKLKNKAATRATKDHDLIFFAVDKPADLERIAKLIPSLAPAGALWLIRPRGKKDVSEAVVREAARAAGLVDVKVARFSETHTAEKYVRPRSSR